MSDLSSSPIFTTIQNQIQAAPVVVYMKGTAVRPMCGFSAYVVQLFQRLNIEFTGINILEDPDLREGIKQFSNWPTVPQIYIRGEFIGGCDILRDLYQSGELIPLLTSQSIPFSLPAD